MNKIEIGKSSRKVGVEKSPRKAGNLLRSSLFVLVTAILASCARIGGEKAVEKLYLTLEKVEAEDDGYFGLVATASKGAVNVDSATVNLGCDEENGGTQDIPVLIVNRAAVTQEERGDGLGFDDGWVAIAALCASGQVPTVNHVIVGDVPCIRISQPDMNVVGGYVCSLPLNER